MGRRNAERFRHRLRLRAADGYALEYEPLAQGQPLHHRTKYVDERMMLRELRNRSPLINEKFLRRLLRLA